MMFPLPARVWRAVPTVAVLSAAPVAAQESLTVDQAEIAMDAAEAEARRNGWNLTIVIADADGVPIQVRRMQGASARSYEIASAKVRTSLATGMATGDYGRAVQEGRMEAIPDGITFEGGYPIHIAGQLVGAMAASGARGSEDAQSVRAGLAAIDIVPEG